MVNIVVSVSRVVDYLVEKSFWEFMMWLFMEKKISNNGAAENLTRVATGT